MFPLLFVTTITTQFAAPAHRIHSPYRTLSTMLPGYPVNNSSAPLRVKDTVVMAFNLQIPDGRVWNARMFSSNQDESNLFLMDQNNIPIAHAHITSNNKGVATNRLTLYNNNIIAFIISTMLYRPPQSPRPKPNPHFLAYKRMISRKKNS